MHFANLKIRLNDSKACAKYTQLRNQLAEYIKVNAVPPGTQLPDIISMVKLSGLSNRSVERAYNCLIADGICFRRPKKGTFVSNPQPVIKSSANKVCAILLPPGAPDLVQDDISGPIYREIHNRAQQENIDLIILSEHTLQEYLKNPDRHLIGVLMMYWYDAQKARRVVEMFPDTEMIFINLHLPDFESMPGNAQGIFNDDFTGGLMIGNYIFEHQIRNFRILSLTQESDNYQRRINGMLHAANTHGITWSNDWIFSPTTSTFSHTEQFEIACSYVRNLIRMQQKFEAILCTNDLLAAGVSSELEKFNLRSRIKVTGYDNILPVLSIAGKFSTVEVDLEKMGRCAIDSLLNKPFTPAIREIEPTLVIR